MPPSSLTLLIIPGDSSKDKEDGSANEMDDPPKIKKRNGKQDETPVHLRDFERKFLLEKGGYGCANFDI